MKEKLGIERAIAPDDPEDAEVVEPAATEVEDGVPIEEEASALPSAASMYDVTAASEGGLMTKIIPADWIQIRGKRN
jgi:hypothetical protein